ncbi:MAG: DUF1501 domain-containing protein [Candidatus Omnitrophica bacterium]|nr:DUF1501 domain-containing protein [Candidatus Omnitrophota bacterium]MCB9782374.1 DUF1501 domain-containing protein [Candidatus Omnitrophota bacterium]
MKTSKPLGCKGFPDRRDFLRVGVLSGIGLTLGDALRLQAAHAEEGSPGPKAESAILIFLSGGMSHVDTFDPKPYSPIEYRGDLGTVKTNTGDVFGSQLPKLAGIADKVSVIRSMSHGEAAHERGRHNMLTGYRPSPAIIYPSVGSVVAHELGTRNDIPPYVSIPSSGDEYMGTGYLSSAYGPFSVGGEPSNQNFEVRDLNLPGSVDEGRMERRKTLLHSVDSHFSELEQSDSLAAMDSYYEKAYSLISSQSAREAFHIAAEPDEIRDEYGRHEMGQRLLLARRLVEGGARFVTVLSGSWDHHINIKKGMETNLPPLDQAVSTLINDLERRGLLKTTLVILATEFGRTVKINRDAGRDHWPKAFSIMMAGGGVQGGIIHGATDAYGSEPVRDPVGPEDYAATVFTLLGINPEKKLMSPGNRPIDIVRYGSVIEPLV